MQRKKDDLYVIAAAYLSCQQDYLGSQKNTQEEIAKALREPLMKVFPPALLGRLIVIPYYPLSDSMIARIIRLQKGWGARRRRSARARSRSYSR